MIAARRPTPLPDPLTAGLADPAALAVELAAYPHRAESRNAGLGAVPSLRRQAGTTRTLSTRQARRARAALERRAAKHAAKRRANTPPTPAAD